MAYYNQCLPVSERIKALKEDANHKGIFFKAHEIAKRLGKGQTMRHGIHYNYDDSKLKIWYDDYGPNLSVTFREQEVFFYQINDVVRYRPDINDWLTEIEYLYESSIKPKITKEENEALKRKNQELFNTWGITSCAQKGETKQ